MSLPLVVLAPVSGTVRAMVDVPDPVFAEEIVGPGLAIDPTRDGVVKAIAPVAGTIFKLHPHAFVIVAPGSRGVLVHLGLDTVQLAGVGFTLHVAEGDTVAAGDVVVSWTPADVEAGGRSPICPVVALEGKQGTVTGLVTAGATVQAGDPLLEWA
ncbi:MAG: PTS sugar transporter subunit IIA [Cellulomonas sp.]